MKFLFLCHALNVGGLETYLLRFARWLRKNHPEHRIEVVCKSGRFGAYESHFREAGVALHALPLGYWHPAPYLRLARLLKQGGHHAVCDFGGDFGGLPMALCRLLRLPRRMVFYRSARNPFVSSVPKKLYQRLVNALVRSCSSAILSNSREAFNYYFRGRPVGDDSRFRVISNGIPAPSPLDSGARERLLGELGIPQGWKVALHVGSGRWEKNHPCLLDIARQAQESGDRLLFLLAGPGVEEICRGSAAGSGLTNVRYLGQRSDVASLLQVADLFLFPSLSEGQPNALLEAMTAGVPFVASDIASVRETLPPGWGRRWLFDPRAPDEGYRLLRSHLEHDYREEAEFAFLVRWSGTRYHEDACFGAFLGALAGGEEQR